MIDADAAARSASSPGPVGRDEWNERAEIAEAVVRARYVGGVPGIAWARSAWPAVPLVRRRRGGPARWHYWWSAHLVEAAVDAAHHRPSRRRRRRARGYVRGVWVRNGARWSRPFYDDIAWLGLALQRGADVVGHRRPAERIAKRLAAAVDPATGAVPWRVGSRLFNAPANGPAAILLARTGRAAAATRLTDWVDEKLRDDSTGLIIDGLVIDDEGTRAVTELYTYCQGVALGADVELANGDDRLAARAVTLIDAIAAWTGEARLLPGSGGGDGGLFAAITCRYLAEAAARLEKTADAAAEPTALRRAAASARSIVIANAEALWAGRAIVDGLPVFASDARTPADPALGASERDLSVQLGAWLTLEAAVAVTS